MSGRRLVLSWPEGEAFGQRLARALGCDHAVVATRRFPDHETYLRLPPSLAGTEVVLNCTLADPDPKLAPLLFAADTARDLGAARVGLVAPYLAYMRQDRRFEAGEAITSRFARVLSASVDWLVTADPHLHRFASLDELYPIPSGVVRAAPLLAGWICENVERPLLLGPDAESRQWVAQAAATMGAPFAVLEDEAGGPRGGACPARPDRPPGRPCADRRCRRVRAHADRGCPPACGGRFRSTPAARSPMRCSLATLSKSSHRPHG